MLMLWCTADGVPLRTEPGKGAKLIFVQKYQMLEKLAETDAVFNGSVTRFFKLRFTENEKQVTEGWAYAGYFEEYRNAFKANVLHIANGTKNPNDAEQYLIWRGRTQYNLCGYFCAAFCANWDAEIEEMLDLLQAKKSSFIARVFPGWQSKGTSDYDLDLMLSTLGFETPSVKIGTVLYDPIAGRMLLTPQRLQNILDSHRIIYSVKINARTGKLARSGVLHWVVLTDVVPNQFGGSVELYNPFGNRMEVYEWDQVVESGGVPYGVLAARR